MIAADWQDYELLACGDGEKLERWGDIYLLRPDPQAIWHPPYPLAGHAGLHAHYRRAPDGGGHWQTLRPLPDEWTVSWRDLTFAVKPMGFKHTGLFPEQACNWAQLRALVEGAGRTVRVLNLFAYTGGATVALARAGAQVTHVDAAKGMVDRCKQNARLSSVADDRIRYIVDDCKKFVQREIKRGKRYNAVLMDPPSYGRGPGGELWKIEDGLCDLVTLVREVLDEPLFFLINSYTTGLQPAVLDNLLSLAMAGTGGRHRGYEVCLPVRDGDVVLPCGCSGLWQARGTEEFHG